MRIEKVLNFKYFKPWKEIKLIKLAKQFTLIGILLSTCLVIPTFAKTPQSITIPDKLETSIGTLEFKYGAPTAATAEKLYDNLDFLHAQNVFLNTYQGASTYALGQGFQAIGAKDNSVVLFSNLMNSKSLFLTANSDTVYIWSILDLKKGPLVVEVPPRILGLIDDMWFRWIIDVGVSGPDRGEGGKYLILPPGYEGPLPDGGYFVARSPTLRVLLLGRGFMENNDPKPVVSLIKKTLKIYPYTPGAFGTSLGTVLEGKVKLIPRPPVPETTFIEASDRAFNTIPPNDYTFYEMINALVQEEPATSLDPELLGQLASIGIVKGKPFAPDARMKKILTDAVNVANATARTLVFSPRKAEGFQYYPDSAWTTALFVGGYTFETPPPMVTKDGIKPFPPTGARALHSRTNFFNCCTGNTPAMVMRLTGVGSQYVYATLDSRKNHLDGAKTYKVTLPRGIPEKNFWSLTLYDNQTRSMLQTDQPFPKAGSLNYPRPAATAGSNGSTVIYFGPKLPSGVKEGNWIQTMPNQGYWAILRLYSPLQPFFDKSWRPSEIELVN